MISCMQCGAANATIHLGHVLPDGQQSTLHLCQACAEKNKMIVKQELNLSQILQTLIGAHVGAWSDELSRLCCPACGVAYMEFRSEGRLGCPHDYEVFRKGLIELLERIHRAVRHQGKTPRRDPAALQRDGDRLILRRQLREAIEQENYEQASKVRDLLRAKETSV